MAQTNCKTCQVMEGRLTAAEKRGDSRTAEVQRITLGAHQRKEHALVVIWKTMAWILHPKGK